LPTTANYIVVSSLLAPVIVALGQQNGLIVPLIAVHLFVFYFGIPAHHRQLHRGVQPAGAGDRRAGPAERADRAADR
ncbi:hypothetical protein, partial [Acinetobacter baumannii]|uniref:hypothetical protein n=1 Tax=Acinetobacter baumannii TaxID=470 RepID=UPI00148A5679